MISELGDINGKSFMMENSNIFLYILLINLFQVSCSTQKIDVLSTKDLKSSTTLHVGDTYEESDLEAYEKIEFSCDGKSIIISKEKANRVYFPSNLKLCLYHKGFNGSKEANRQIALLVDLLGYEFVSIFGNRKDFRGPEIFKALLRRAEHPHKRSAHLYYAKQMIATIDNFSGSDIDKYVKKVNDLPEFVVVTAKGSKGDPEWEAIRFRTIKKAWEDGKIVLKSFGQE